jgi:hypothetical protein
MTAELAYDDRALDAAVERMVSDSEFIRAQASQACQTSAIAITRSELLRARFEAARDTLFSAVRETLLAPAVVEIEPDVAPRTEAPETKRSRRTREAHFAIASILVDGEPWVVRYASLDVYHQGPDFEDPNDAIWEVQCTIAPDTRRLEVRREYSLVIDARNGRRFSGRVFTQHSSSELCTLLDTGEPLVGLESADYLA